MTLSNKTPSTQLFRLMLYQRALHPELFAIQTRRNLRQSDYELEAWIFPGGHNLRFQAQGECATEVVFGEEIQLPERGLIHHLPCIGEKEYEVDVEETIRFVTAVQTENLSDNLYLATFNEMTDFAREGEAMTHQWQDPQSELPNLSILDLQRFRGEVHAQSYHLIAQGGFVLRTQSIFELI